MAGRDQTFITAAWFSARTSLTAGERSAATATGRASFGSFLLVARWQQPQPGTQLGLHIDHVLTRGCGRVFARAMVRRRRSRAARACLARNGRL
jgi:hypothetical protein